MEGAKLANAGPLGLAGFGMTTMILNIHNTGYFPMATSIMAMGIFYGGIAQIIAGILEFKNGNTFATTAFISMAPSGLLWSSSSSPRDCPRLLPPFSDGISFSAPSLFLDAVRPAPGNRVLQFVFFSLIILFWLLAISEWFGAPTVAHVAGWIGLACGFAAFYLAMAEVINESRGKRSCLSASLQSSNSFRYFQARL